VYGGDEECVENFAWRLKGRGNSAYLGADGRIILKWILRK
jgi:hypothetical protein